jgi:DNA-binding GntR family transcriptional regulator
MKTINVSPSLTEQVYRAIVDEILEGRLRAGEHLVQEQLASSLGVSRQPVQQAMALLKADGMIEEVGKRGLRVAKLDLGRMRCHYDIRVMLDGYAARSAASGVADGSVNKQILSDGFHEVFAGGAEAIRNQSVKDQIHFDEAFHKLIYSSSNNSVLRSTVEPHWRYMRRVMAEVLMHAEPATAVWDQHRLIADAILSGDPEKAGALAEDHVQTAIRRLGQAAARKDQPEADQVSVA